VALPFQGTPFERIERMAVALSDLVCDANRVDRSRSFARAGQTLLIALIVSIPIQGAGQERAASLVVDDFTLVGVESIDESALRDVLATRASPWLPWRDAFPFDPRALELDLRRVVAYYLDHGFPDARILSHDVNIDEANREVDVVVRVQEGEPTLIDDVSLEGFDVLPATELESLHRRLPQVGDIAVRAGVLAGTEMAAASLKDAGYAYAEVQLEQEAVGPKRIQIRYEAEPGTQAFFGPIEVVGNASVDDSIVRRQLTYRPGEPFSLNQVRAGQRQLYGLELFQFATVDPQEAGRPIDVPTRVTVAEGDHRRLRFSIGWGIEEKLRGEASWRHVNFYGGARVLAAHGKWSSLESGGEIDFTQPYLFHPRLSLSVTGHALYAEELAYRAGSEGGRIAIVGRASERTRWSVTYGHELTRSEVSNAALNDLSQRDTLIALGLDPTTGRQEGVLSSVSLALDHATTDDLLNPQRGRSVTLQIEQAGTLLPGDFNYTSANVDVRAYTPFGSRVVFAARIHAAGIDPTGGADEVPFHKRYFLGGSSSLRGWGRFQVAPISAAGLPLGGFSLLETSVELRARVWQNLGLVAFVDAGDVWDGSWKYNLGKLRYDIGPGLRYRTPVGPVRADLAYQLTPIEGLLVDGEPQNRKWRVHFSIGQSF
jgi:outer membrane protein assembly complex protein YaeT